MNFFSMKKYSIQDKKLLAAWAADCAERVLPFFENSYPKDNHPRKAIEACRSWVSTGISRMSDIRGASLAAHASARKAKENKTAFFAARAAGQAVATAHVPQHAFGSYYYALKAIASTNPFNVAKERNWQLQRLPKHLRQEVMKRIMILKNNQGILVKIKKGKGF